MNSFNTLENETSKLQICSWVNAILEIVSLSVKNIVNVNNKAFSIVQSGVSLEIRVSSHRSTKMRKRKTFGVCTCFVSFLNQTCTYILW